MIERINEPYFSPHYTCIKAGFILSDEEILKRLGLDDFRKEIKPSDNINLSLNYIYITEDHDWLYILDNWAYEIWHRNFFREKLIELSTDFEIYNFSVGDADDSFDFLYLVNGKIKRKYVVTDPYYKGGKVDINIGESFPIEEMALAIKDHYQKLKLISTTFGISLTFDKENVRVFKTDKLDKIDLF